MSEYLIDQILPKQELSLMAGPSGAGKTRWLFDTMLEWQQGDKILGYDSFPVPWLYISADRSTSSVGRTLDAMKIPRDSIPFLSAWSEHLGINGIFDEIEKTKAEFVVWESFGSFVDPPALAHQVKALFERCDKFMQKSGVTVLGVVECPKMKPSEKYDNPRQRISGVATWGHYAETVFLLEPYNAEVPSDPFRILNVCPRNTPGITLELAFNDQGHLKVTNFLQHIEPKRVRRKYS